MNQAEQIQEVELSLVEARKIVSFSEAIQRLLTNRDFQLVIDQGYMTEEPRRLTLLLGEENLTDQQRDNVLVALRAIGEFHTFLRARQFMGEQMRKDVADAEEELSIMRTEEGSDEGSAG